MKARFGNKQQIINRQMEILLNLESVTSRYHVRSLRELHDTVESNVRSLKSSSVSSESYGGLLSSILMNKLPQEFPLVITGAQPKAGTGLKMQTVRFFNVTLLGIYRWLIEILSAILKRTRHGGQSRERL